MTMQLEGPTCKGPCMLNPGQLCAACTEALRLRREGAELGTLLPDKLMKT